METQQQKDELKKLREFREKFYNQQRNDLKIDRNDVLEILKYRMWNYQFSNYDPAYNQALNPRPILSLEEIEEKVSHTPENTYISITEQERELLIDKHWRESDLSIDLNYELLPNHFKNLQ
jgi:hypothetical protein